MLSRSFFNHPRQHGSQSKIHKDEKKFGIILYAGDIQGVASTLVLQTLLENEQRLSVGVLLMVLKSKIKPSTLASFHNIQSPKVVIGLVSNHFHEFW